MRRAILAFIYCGLTLGSGVARGADALAEGRWSGTVDIPGRTLRLVVDLAPGPAGWTGSMIVAGLGISGASLSNIAVAGRDVAFDTGNALTGPGSGPARFEAQLSGEDMSGEMRQGGNVARFSLHRMGAAQVAASMRSTPVRTAFVGRWTGSYELGGYPRNVTVTVENRADAGAAATFVIVGRQTTQVPVDRVVEDGEFLRLESHANRVTFEGRLDQGSDEIRGTVELGPFELPLVLRRSAGGAS